MKKIPSRNFLMSFSVSSNPVAVITGAGAGIGCALSLKAAREGNNVALVDLNQKSVISLQQQLSKQYPTQVFKAYKCDVTSSNDMKTLATNVSNDFNGQIKYLFNNVGTDFSCEVLTSNVSKLRKMMDINLWSAVEMTQLFLPLLKNNKHGISRIINTSSVSGIILGDIMYAITKHANKVYSEVVINELKNMKLYDKIKCHLLLPGPVDTHLMRNVSTQKYGKGNIKTFSGSLNNQIMKPDLIAEYVWDAFKNEYVYIYTHFDWAYAAILHRFNCMTNQKIKNKNISTDNFKVKIDREKFIKLKYTQDLASKL